MGGSLTSQHDAADANRERMNVPPAQSAARPIASGTLSRNDALAAALDHIRSGALDEAIGIFQAVLTSNPLDADAIHLWGVAADAKGNAQLAIDLIRKALAIREMASYRSNLGLALSHLGQHEAAIAEYRRAVELEPDYPEAMSNLGISLEALRRSAEAEQAYRTAIALRPGYAEAWGNLGNTLRAQGRNEEAVAAYRQALAHNPAAQQAPLGNALRSLGRTGEAEAAFRADVSNHPGSADALNNLAAILGENDRVEEAAALLPQITAMQPNFAEAHANLGQVLQRLGRLEEAVAACSRALELRPDYPEALTNLGNALRLLNRLPEAEAALRRALAQRPTDVGCYNNLAITLQAQDRPYEALGVLDLAAALDPSDPETHHHRAMLLLRLGRFAEGWEDYEWRFQIKQSGDAYKHFAGQTGWDGGPLEGRTILLVPEQGLGDSIQFARYAPLLCGKGARVVLGAQRPLTRLFRSLAGDIEIVGTGEPLPRYDTHCPLLSLPRALGTTLETIPAAVPYLSAEPEAVTGWAERLRVQEPGLRVGLVWAGNPQHLGDRQRSIPVEALAPLLRHAAIRWFSLQVGERSADRLADEIDDLSPGLSDFAETAAAIAGLDLVITVDTSVAHLAGALGRPVWVLLPFVPDWRWLRTGTASPWYPTMRLFRQDERRNWEPAVANVSAALAELVTAPKRSADPFHGKSLQAL